MSTAEAERTEGGGHASTERVLPRPSEQPPTKRSRGRSRPEPGWAKQVLVDIGCFIVASGLAVLIRFDLDPSTAGAWAALALGAVMGVLQMGAGYVNGLYRGRTRYASFDNVFSVLGADVIVTVLGLMIWLGAKPATLPRSLPLSTGVLALVFMLGVRCVARWWWLRRISKAHSESTIVIGAGENGEHLVRAMVSDENSPYRPVALLDDDPAKRRLQIYGVPVVGGTAELYRVLRDTGARNVVVAMSRAEASQLLAFDLVCRQAGAQLRVVPSSSQVVGGAVTLGDISEVTDEDLLGRRPVEVNEDGIRELLRGQRVLITGAGGSIGSELARQVYRYSPAAVYLLDRDESALHQVSLSIDGRAMLDKDDLILADIRDEQRMAEVFGQVRPDIVLHAAALKHMPLLEKAPHEAWKTNVLGTQTVINEAIRHGVRTLVNISTDKAANPENVLGYSKRITERLVARAEVPDGAHYVSVRFGNVLGSRGSVLTTFRAQIARGGPVTVTDPEVTRYFMTVAEAVHLVLQAASLNERRGVLVLDMGEPRRILDVARTLIDNSGRDIRIEYTGLRNGEKLHESVFDSSETPRSTSHSMVSYVPPQPLRLDVWPEVHDDDEALKVLMRYGSSLAHDEV